MKIAMLADDGFSKLLATGLTFSFALQTFIIVGGILRVIPLTGVTLPFVSDVRQHRAVGRPIPLDEIARLHAESAQLRVIEPEPDAQLERLEEENRRLQQHGDQEREDEDEHLADQAEQLVTHGS